MNYKQIYQDICNRAKLERDLRIKNRKEKIQYYESHHIIPRCMGGEGELRDVYHDNIVQLTAREHFICHKLLCKIFPNEKGLFYAVWNMTSRSGAHDKMKRHIPSSREYESLRKKFSELMSKNNPGRNKSIETRKKLSESKKSKPSPRKGCKHTEESKLKMSRWQLGEKNPRFGKRDTPEVVEKRRQSILKAKQNAPIIECPYCGLCSKSASNMSRYHFEKCKQLNKD